MATTLRDFIAHREAEIRELQKALKVELRDLQLAKGAIDSPATSPAPGSAAPTIKEMAREILSGQPNGLNSSGILDGIKKTFGREIERTSLSPQLSRMKDDGEVVLDGDVWFTAENHAAKTRQETESTAAPSGRQDATTQNPVAASWEEDDSDVPF